MMIRAKEVFYDIKQKQPNQFLKFDNKQIDQKYW